MRKGDGGHQACQASFPSWEAFWTSLISATSSSCAGSSFPFSAAGVATAPGHREDATEGGGAIEIEGEFVVMANTWLPLGNQ